MAIVNPTSFTAAPHNLSGIDVPILSYVSGEAQTEHNKESLRVHNEDVVDSDNRPEERSTGFDSLIDDLKQILGPSSGINADDVDTESLMDKLKQYVSTRSDWQRFAFEDNAMAYTRNGVDTINSKANLLVLVWTPGRGSAVHDHANAHCIVKVLQGTLRETLYYPPDNDDEASGDSHHHPHALRVRRVTDFQENDVSYMSDTLGLHRMENVGSTPAVSLHLYTPPYAAKFGCNVYEENGEKHHVSMSSLYSDKGVRLNVHANTC